MQLPVLDFHTSFGMTSLSAYVLVGVLWLLGRGFAQQGLSYAMGGAFSFGTAYLFLALQKSLPYQTAMTAAHLCIALGITLMCLCYQRFRQRPWGREDAALVTLPFAAMALWWGLFPDSFGLQARGRGALFIAMMLWQISFMLRMRKHTPGSGWTLVLAAQVVQTLSMLPMLFMNERSSTPNLEAGSNSLAVIVPWMMCIVMFLNLQVSALGFLLMLKDRQSATERKLAGLDALTQLPNRRTLMAYVPQAMQQAIDRQQALGLLVLDIDHFKKVNDTYGHLGGDAVLHRVAWVLRNQIRQGDFVARYGGEEFVIVIPNATPAVLLGAAQRIGQAVRSELVSYEGERIRVSVSLGGHVQLVQPGLRWEELLAAADAALYEAKNTGRDRVVLSAVSRSQLPPAAVQEAPQQASAPNAAGERRTGTTRS